MNIYYRISDCSIEKARFTDKRRSLTNFLRVFAPGPGELTILADRCGDATVEMIRDVCRAATPAVGEDAIRRTVAGNAGSWRCAAELALKLPDDAPVYFLEDDYLHLPGSRSLLLEGLTIADYVTLYDHPDKYINRDQGGNPLVEQGGEMTRVVRTTTTHWKYTNSTTMTFAVAVRILRQDWPIWDLHTRGYLPVDMYAFLALREKGRRVAVSLPGRSTHCEPQNRSPFVDWESV